MNDVVFNEEKNQELESLLIQLFLYDEDEIEEIISEFKRIYDGKYRHSYARISRLVYYMEVDERETISGALDSIILELSKEEKEKSADNSSVIKSIIKLKDHIDLEIMRYNLDDEANKKLENALEIADELSNSTSELFDEVQELQDNSWNLKEKINSFDTQSITILSIFAGLVFVFTGGFSFIGTALQNVNNASVYKLTFVLSFVGMVIFNLIFLFFYMVARLTNKNISSSCSKTASHNCGYEDECDNCSFIKRYLRRFYYMLIPNTVFIALMIAAVVAWLIRRG